MGLDYSYTQPSESDHYGVNSEDSVLNQTEADIMLDQAEIEASRRHYPPQPEVEFGFPKTCYCGGDPLVATSYTRTDPGRRYYTCKNVDDGDCHVWKWWDVAVMEEMRAMDSQYEQLCQKVDSLNLMAADEGGLRQVKERVSETEQRLVRIERLVCDLAKKKSLFSCKKKFVVGFLVMFVVVAGMIMMFK